MFIALTIMFLLAGNFAIGILFKMAHEIPAWTNLLNRLYASPKENMNLLGKALGDCEQCMAHWFCPLWFVAYWYCTKYGFGVWPIHGVLVNFIWFSCFWSLSSKLNHLALIKIFNKKK